ncbi:fibronectin type III domain-containing protein [Dactylosporangium sp. NPDC051541]|uniref:fibronectin type III domain-containing protein n=1 Tax=Dactylosporangium sp. NPDC051541 TaxID=3363977 RepID=UPI003799347F
MAINLRSGRSGALITGGTIVALVAVLGLTLWGTGAANHAVASFDVSAWLWSADKGEVARVNGVTGKVDTRTKIADAQGHSMQVTQSDRFVILRDLNTGKVSVLDLSSLTLGATTQSTPGLGVTVAVHDDTAFIVDTVQGQVRQLDPMTLLPVGETLSFPPGISAGTFDDRGRLWLLVPSEGTVVGIDAAKITPASPAGGAGGQGAGGQGGGSTGNPAKVRTVGVADPNHDLALSILDSGVAVLDKTATTLTTVRGDAVKKVPLKLDGEGGMPDRTVGGDVPVTVVDGSHVYVVDNDKVSDFTVPGDSPKLQPCVAWSARFYCADDASGTVYVLDAQGKALDPIRIQAGGKPLEIEVREDRMFINAPGGSTARVVDAKNHVTTVDKYANDVLGGDAPPAPPPAQQTKPPVTAPGAPARVNAVAGNTTARVTWTAAPPNGSAVTKYVVEGDGAAPHEVGASQRAIDITGLTNGTQYKFTVYAVNAKGNGPKKAANPVTPTRDVPDAPVSVAATANPDGTVAVTWPEANGQGHKIAKYVITTVGSGEAKTFESAKPEFAVPAGELPYGTQVAFKVAAINDIGGSSGQSPLSPSVVPFNKPGAPTGLTLKASTSKRGTVVATWKAPADNGSPLTGYEATVNGTKSTINTALTHEFTGFKDAEAVTIQLRAVNKAGQSAAASASGATLAAPKMTVAGATAALNSITVRFTATDGGSPGTCKLEAGGTSTSGACSGSLTLGGLWPNTAYAYTVTVTNGAGMTANGTGSVSTPVYKGTVVCNDPGYCGKTASGGGIWVYKAPSQSGSGIGDTFNGESWTAICWANSSTGTSINAKPYGGKETAIWIKIAFQGENYIPYAWLNLPNGTTPLKQC